MRRTFLKIAFSAAAILVLVILIFLFFVYPDDARVPVLTADSAPDSEQLEFVGSVLNSRLVHQIDIDAEIYTDLAKQYQVASDSNVLLRSARFTSKYQILVSTGFYPWRLEAADGIAIPTGHTLTVEVPDKADRMEMPVPAGNSFQLSIGLVGAEPKRLTGTDFTRKSALPGFISRAMDKYFFIGSYQALPRWQVFQTRLDEAESRTLKIECISEGGFCLVGDPKFYRPSQEKKPRQTIMVLIDTLRSDAVNVGTMPQLSALATQGIDFSNTLAPGNMTSPSANGFLACQTPTDLGAVAFAYTVGSENSEKFYKKSKTSFPAMLKAQGILTAMIGNISVVSDIYGVGVNHGFERQILSESEGYETPLAISEAIRWLKENRNKDFFLYVHLNNPHAPYRAPLKYITGQFRSRNDFSSYPSILRWLYRAEAAFADFQVGLLLGYLKDQGLYDQVDIVVTSDHGDQHSVRRFDGNQIAQDFVGTYFDHGASLYNDEIQVPLILKANGSGSGKVTDFVSSLWIGKTILGLNHVAKKISAECAGEDLNDYAKGLVKKAPVLGTEGFHARALVFDGRFKYIRTYDPTEKRIYSDEKISGIKKSFLKREQLFDLLKDPDETMDLSRNVPQLLEQARIHFREYFQITSSYELILESPGISAFEIKSRVIASRHLGIQDGVTDFVAKKEKIAGTFSDRVGIKFKYDNKMAIPVVLINGVEVPVRLTTMKLPGSGFIGILPEETLSWVRSTPGPSAYVVRVLDERRKDRKIALGNPAFEKVLREWGYINEN